MHYDVQNAFLTVEPRNERQKMEQNERENEIVKSEEQTKYEE